MADQYSARISIGGPVTAKQWRQICLRSDIFEMFDPQGDQDHVGDYGEVYLGIDGTLIADHPEVSWGQFHCEDYLVEQGIPFERTTAPDYGHPGAAVAFRPGMERPIEVDADSEGDPYVTFEQLDKFFARMGEANSEAKLEELGEGLIDSQRKSW